MALHVRVQVILLVELLKTNETLKPGLFPALVVDVAVQVVLVLVGLEAAGATLPLRS